MSRASRERESRGRVVSRILAENSVHLEAPRHLDLAFPGAKDSDIQSSAPRGLGNKAIVTEMVSAFADQQVVCEPQRSHGSSGKWRNSRTAGQRDSMLWLVRNRERALARSDSRRPGRA